MLTIQPTRRRLIGIRVREDRVRVTERSGENLRVAEGVAIAVAQRQTGEVEVRPFTGHRVMRSEEHTSELQSLMRISYAVFCLKKKNNHSTHHMTQQRRNA